MIIKKRDVHRGCRAEVAWAVLRGVIEVAVVIAAATGQHELAIALAYVGTQAEIVRASSPRD